MILQSEGCITLVFVTVYTLSVLFCWHINMFIIIIIIIILIFVISVPADVVSLLTLIAA